MKSLAGTRPVEPRDVAIGRFVNDRKVHARCACTRHEAVEDGCGWTVRCAGGPLRISAACGFSCWYANIDLVGRAEVAA